MTSMETTKHWIDSSISSQLEFLEKIVSINSHTSNHTGVNLVQDEFQREFASLGLKVTRLPVEGAGECLLASNCADSACALFLSGHVDTVHPKESKFQTMTVEGDRITGPGVLDMKGGLSVLVWALKALSHAGLLSKIPLRIFLNSEEEAGSPHSRGEILRIASASRAALVFEWGRTANSLITMRKGVQGITLRASGKKSHSGNHHADGRNAIEALCHAVIAAQKITNYQEGVTVSANIISGGTSGSTVPAEAMALCDVRTPTNEKLSAVRKCFKEVAAANPIAGTSISVEMSAGMPPLEETQLSKELFERYRLSAEKIGVHVRKVEAPLGGGSDANLIASVGTPVLDGLGPLGDGAHTDSEYVLLPSITERTACLAAYLVGTIG